ncbi:MAG TPA: hypothetical protein EYN80_10070 [Alphaproteobacteria bacterium]|jgi:hypothetical protein|nr:hypothetical protein [Alphaproteobacteria bacterium]HIB19242.1 hypothetical protein [Alphaproteobacteria bacterium]
MQIVLHRRNTLSELEATPTKFGVEVDIRSYGNDIIIHHDPFVAGERFDKWIAGYQHKLLILNIKEEGLEERLIGMMDEHGVEDFFFLDQSFPFLIKTAKNGEGRCAARVSEYEPITLALSLKGLISWVWVDCFSGFPLTGASAKTLQRAGFQLCLVSPELQGRTDPKEIFELKDFLTSEKIKAEAVCTKRPDLWGTNHAV